MWVCVLRSMCLKIVVEWCFWEFKMLIGSLVVLHAWLHSYLCFSLLEKLFLSNLDNSLTPLDTCPFCRDLKLVLITISTTVSIAGGSIKKVFGPSIAFRQLVDQSSFFDRVWWILPWHLSLALSVDVSFSWHLCWHLAWYLSTPLSVENYWGSIYRLQRDPILIFSISLDLSAPIHLPNTFFSLKTFNPRDFRPFLASNHLVWSLFLSLFMHLDLGFGVFEKFWGFSKLLSYCWNFGMSFWLNEFKTSCITSHLHYNYIFMHLDVCYIC